MYFWARIDSLKSLSRAIVSLRLQKDRDRKKWFIITVILKTISILYNFSCDFQVAYNDYIKHILKTLL